MSEPLPLFPSMPPLLRGDAPGGAVVEVELQWQKVARRNYERTYRADLGPCWICLHPVEGSGYPVIRWRRKLLRCHRVSYQRHKGVIPSGFMVTHRCDVRRCVNPGHLEAKPGWRNSAEASGRGRYNRSPSLPLAWAELHYARSANDTLVNIGRVVGRQFRAVGDLRHGRTYREVWSTMIVRDPPVPRMALARWVETESRWELVIEVRCAAGVQVRSQLERKAADCVGPTRIIEFEGVKGSAAVQVRALSPYVAPGGAASPEQLSLFGEVSS